VPQAYGGNGNDLISIILKLNEIENANGNDLISTIASINEFELQYYDNT
jgi:hypothetical protein